MRNHYANYFKRVPNFKEVRTKLVTLNSPEEILTLLRDIEQMKLPQWLERRIPAIIFA